MSPFRNRLKTPEEIELGLKRCELANVQCQLAEQENVFFALRSEIRTFEQRYEQILGGRIGELEDLEWQLNGLLGRGDEMPAGETIRSEENFSQFRHRTDLLDDDGEPERHAPQKSLKNLYREVAKAIHPDLAADEEERLRRQELMSVANHAYDVGDRKTLEDILCDWEQGPELISGMDVAMELVRVIRQIARARQNIHAALLQIEELKQTDIYRFKLRVDEAQADGIDLLAEMAATVDLDIIKIKNRLSLLRGDGHDAKEKGMPPLETRLIRFPPEQHCGSLYVRRAGSVDYRDWQRLGNARGVREIFLEQAVRLDVKGTTELETRFLESLQPDDLQALFLYDIDDSALKYLAHLSGLQELYLSNTTVSDQGLLQLMPLQGLRRLYIYHTAISDVGLYHLSGLSGLKWLTCSGTGITVSGMAKFRQMLSGCKAVSFEWKHG